MKKSTSTGTRVPDRTLDDTKAKRKPKTRTKGLLKKWVAELDAMILSTEIGDPVCTKDGTRIPMEQLQTRRKYYVDWLKGDL